jgi:SHOCT-like domain
MLILLWVIVNITNNDGILSGGAVFYRRRALRQRGGDDVMQEGQTMSDMSDMSEERAQILEMLVAGRVTVEQADQLLKALDATSPGASHELAAQTGRQRRWNEPADDFFARLTPEQLIELRDHDVSRAFIEQMRAAGLNDLSVADLIDLYDHGITPRFVLDLREAGFIELTRDDLIELYDHGVDAAFVREMRGLGFANLAPGEWVELRNHGVESDFARGMRSHDSTGQGGWEEPGQ